LRCVTQIILPPFWRAGKAAGARVGYLGGSRDGSIFKGWQESLQDHGWIDVARAAEAIE
jgi:hypothetical protein